MGAHICPVTGERLADDRYVSPHGMRRYEEACLALPGIMEALEGIKSMEVRRGPKVPVKGGHMGSRPACALGVVAAAEPHERTLLKWGNRIAAREGWLPPGHWGRIAFALRRGAAWMGVPEAEYFVPEVIGAVKALSAIVEPPPEGKFWGRCLTVGAEGVCDAPIYADAAASWARCPECGRQWELRDLLETHLGVAADYLVTPTEGAALLKRAGFKITAATIRSWRQRGKVGTSDGRYRIGDLLSAAL